jgi:tight adherence protein B
VQSIAEHIREEKEQQSVVEAELSSARSTGRMLAFLPVVGVAMGVFIGADPLAFITGSLLGQVCALAASVLASIGLYWSERLVGGEV